MAYADLLPLLRCPRTASPLKPADASLLAQLGLDEALVNELGSLAYPVQRGIPILLAEEAIPLDTTSAGESRG